MAITVSGTGFIKDNKRFFYLADTCWSAFTNIHEEDWLYYLQHRKKQGYNVLQINILPQWDASGTSLNHVPYKLDENGNYDFKKINKDYFEHARAMCLSAKELGFELALVVLWCNYVPETWANGITQKNTMPFEDLDLYLNVVHDTFSDLDPIYVISGDTDLDHEITRSYYLKAGKILRQRTPTCLQTLHVRGG